MHILSFLRTCRLACSDRPDWLIGNHDFREILRTQIKKTFCQLKLYVWFMRAGSSDLQRFSTAEDRSQAICQRRFHFCSKHFVTFLEVFTTLTVTDYYILYTEGCKNLCRNFTCVSTCFFV